MIGADQGVSVAGERGCVALDDIRAGELLLEIPVNCCLSVVPGAQMLEEFAQAFRCFRCYVYAFKIILIYGCMIAPRPKLFEPELFSSRFGNISKHLGYTIRICIIYIYVLCPIICESCTFFVLSSWIIVFFFTPLKLSWGLNRDNQSSWTKLYKPGILREKTTQHAFT